MLASCKSFLRYCLFGSTQSHKFSKRYHATLIDGKSIATKILEKLSIEAASFEKKYKRKVLLTCLLIGDGIESMIYVRNKVNACEKVGIRTNVIMLPSCILERDLVTQIHELNTAEDVDGILLQLPLPDHIKMNVCDEICPRKDVDGFTSTNLGKLFLNTNTLIPCTALAVHRVLREINADTKGMNAVICGRSKHVSLPIAMLLHSNFESFGFNATTTICHRFTPAQELTKLCREADILISATGTPSLIRGDMVKKGAIVVDVGIKRIKNLKTAKVKLVGDVNFNGKYQFGS